jgi:hypothetical protein
MPTFNVFVSISRDEIPADFVLEASKFIAGLLGKPEQVRLFVFAIFVRSGSDYCIDFPPIIFVHVKNVTLLRK